jgi:hypothetical protein
MRNKKKKTNNPNKKMVINKLIMINHPKIKMKIPILSSHNYNIKIYRYNYKKN